MNRTSSLKPSEIARRKHHRHKRTFSAALGAVILLFAVIGVGICLFSVIRWGIDEIRNYTSPTESVSFFESYLNPVTGVDPEPVKDLESSDADWKLKSAVWAAAVSGKNNGTYGETANQREIVPSQDVMNTYEKLFGDRIEPVFGTFIDNGVSFEYDSKRKCFYVPLNAVNYVFASKVTHIQRKGSTVTLTVQYLPSTGLEQQPTVNVPSKTMIYILKGGRGTYYIHNIQNIAPAASSIVSSGLSDSSSSSSVSTDN